MTLLFFLSPPYEDIVRRQLSVSQKKVLTKKKSPHQKAFLPYLDLGCSSLQNCEEQISVVEVTQSMVFCYDSLKRLRQPH